ncbi:calcium-binding protein [Kitasatospora sp. NPDC085895]|uniref:calcium-binding protein n=1 Tax=Kitasatospora sp. NPDC085895 TaxID=3155057 RepID=UPI00344D1EDB
MGTWSRGELDRLVDEAIVDAYGQDEEESGLFAMVQDHLSVPFTTTVLGVEVNVIGVDLTASGIVAVCARGSQRQAVGLLDLPLPTPAPEGAQWIEAYRHWAC